MQFDAAGRPVIEVEDVTAARKRVLRPDLVVLSTGMVPADGDRRASPQTLGVDRDEDGFIEILDRKNRATETSGEGIFVCGSAAGPKALIEVNTEASAVASEIHNFLTSAGRRGTRGVAGRRRPVRRLRHLHRRCAPSAPSRWSTGRSGAARPAEVKDDGKLAVIDAESCRACGICAANCPEVAIAHNLSDDALFGRIATDDAGRRQAGRRLLLQGVRRRRHRPRAASGATTTPRACGSSSCRAWGASARCTSSRRPAWAPPACSSPAAPRAAASTAAATRARSSRCTIAEEVLAEGGTPLPLELWHLCAVDRLSVGRRIRMFHARAVGDELSLETLEHEMELIGAGRRPRRRRRRLRGR